MPATWLWHHLTHHPSQVTAGRWNVTVVKRDPPPPPSPSGWLITRATLQRIATTLDRWISRADTGAGAVKWPGGELNLAAAHWENRTLHVTKFSFRNFVADAAATFGQAGDDVIDITLDDAADEGGATLSSRGADVKGTVQWWGQPLRLDTTFAAEGWMPKRADAYADGVEIPAERVKLEAAYATLGGHAHVHWEGAKLHADVAAHAAPAKPQSPPIDITFRADGDAQAVTIEALHASVPGGTANLTAPLTIERSGRIRETTAQFALHVDLAQQPWFKGTGVVEGDARVVATGKNTPAVEFTVSGENLVLPGMDLRRARVVGELAWPVLSASVVELVGQTDAERVTAKGGWNFGTKTLLPTQVSGTMSRAAIARWVPASVSFDRAKIDVSAGGPVAAIESRGEAEVSNLHVAPIRPGNVALTWQAVGPRVSGIKARFKNADLELAADGSVSTEALELAHFVMRETRGHEMQLQAPASIRWRPQVEIESLHLAGGDASIEASVAMGESGHLGLVLKGLSSDWVTGIYPLRGPAWTIPSFAMQGKWSKGPMAYTAAGGVDITLPDHRSAVVNVALHGDGHALTLEALHAVERGNAVVNASGEIPIVLSPGSRPMFALAQDGPLNFQATTVPNAAFWQQLAEMTGVDLRAPQVSAHLTGTWAKPRGSVEFRVDHAAMDPKRFARPLPTVDNVDVALTADMAGVELERFSLAIEKQLVRVSGKLPVDRTTWEELSKNPLPYVQRHAQLRVEVPDAEVAVFTRYMPAALAPAGRLQADIRFDRGALGGFLRLRDAASRPLGPLGVLQQITADVDFEDHRVVLRRVAALSGGQPVAVTGTVELPAEGWTSGELTEPRYDIAVRGDNLPFVRQSGMLIRGDVDLKLQTPDTGSPRISGKVTLRDSLFLTDVRAFLPHGGTASASRRPPYFAVETPPLNTWTLDISVVGARFMRIRMPVFAGLASTHFHLGGTLGDPRAIGEATIDEGTVRMPFATFSVRQGAVRLTEESPYEPTIYLRGTGQHWGYDLTLEVTGKAASPKITFSSSPALDPEQVLLMVMTGAAPSNEVNSSLTHRAVAIGAFFGSSLMGSLTGGGDTQDKLSIESGAKISEQGKETYDIEYKLSDRWTLTGEYDEFDQYIAGLKWRVAPKKKNR